MKSTPTLVEKQSLTKVEKLGRELLDGLATGDLDKQAHAFKNLVRICSHAVWCSGLTTPNNDPTREDVATDVILAWIRRGDPTTAKWLPKQTKNRVIDLIRKHTTYSRARGRLVFPQNAENGEGDTYTTEETLSYLHQMDLADVQRIEILDRFRRECVVCFTTFEARNGAKYCSPKCRKRAQRKRQKFIFPIVTTS